MLGMLREMALVRRRQRELEVDTAELLAETAFPLKVYFHWACRGMAEFALLDNQLLEACRCASTPAGQHLTSTAVPKADCACLDQSLGMFPVCHRVSL